MNDLELSHIALVCPDLSEALVSLGRLGLTPTLRKQVPAEGVEVAFLPLGVARSFRLEVVVPQRSAAEAAGVRRFLEKHKKGALHHLCFETGNLENTVRDLVQKGATFIEPVVRDGARGRVAFLHPQCTAGVLVELEERLEDLSLGPKRV